MSTSASAVRFDDDCLWVHLDDGRIIAAPLAWFPKLLRASADDRQRFEFSPHGIHWEHLDEDISVAGLLAGQGDMTRNVVPVSA